MVETAGNTMWTSGRVRDSERVGEGAPMRTGARAGVGANDLQPQEPGGCLLSKSARWARAAAADKLQNASIGMQQGLSSCRMTP